MHVLTLIMIEMREILFQILMQNSYARLKCTYICQLPNAYALIHTPLPRFTRFTFQIVSYHTATYDFDSRKIRPRKTRPPENSPTGKLAPENSPSTGHSGVKYYIEALGIKKPLSYKTVIMNPNISQITRKYISS